MIQKVCPDCHRTHGTVVGMGKDRTSVDILTICCPACYLDRVRKLHERESLPDDFDPAPLDVYQPPFERLHRPHSSGRRIIRKSEPLGG